MGDYHNRKMVFEVPTADRLKPLPKAASALLVKYYRYCGFWEAYTDTDDFQWAGRTMLNLERSQSAAIAAELNKSGGPWAWFRDRTLEGIAKGTIPHGHETVRSDDADRFFMALIGGPFGAEGVVGELGHRARVGPEEICDPAQGEAMAYIALNLNPWFNRNASDISF